MPGIESEFVIDIQLTPECIRFPVVGMMEDLAFLIYQGRNACIGRTGNTTAGFNGPDPGLTLMLPVPRSITPPSVIGKDKNEACIFL